MPKQLPNWMQDGDNKESSPNTNSTTETVRPRRAGLRSSTAFDRPNNKENVVQKIAPSSYPFIDYKGKIHYSLETFDIAIACDTLLQWTEEQTDTIIPIAFDMEWPFSFKEGPGRSSVIQLCAQPNQCYVFQINEFGILPSVLMALLYHPKVILHGVNIKNDFRKLQRDFPHVNADKLIGKCVDLGVWYNEVFGSSGRWSLERLVLRVCHLQINKDKKVRHSKWNVYPLTEEQQLYAAIDVYISQVIYYEIDKQLKANELKAAETIEETGLSKSASDEQ